MAFAAILTLFLNYAKTPFSSYWLTFYRISDFPFAFFNFNKERTLCFFAFPYLFVFSFFIYWYLIYLFLFVSTSLLFIFIVFYSRVCYPLLTWNMLIVSCTCLDSCCIIILSIHMHICTWFLFVSIKYDSMSYVMY